MKANSYIPSLLTAAIISASGTAGPALAGSSAKHSAAESTHKMVQETRSEINDAWLQGKLESALLFNQYLNSFDIDSEVTNSVAILTGTVESDIDRDLAGEIAQSIDGVDRVENKLQVGKTSADAGSDKARERESLKKRVLDATLAARVKAQLMLNSNIAGLAIDVDSEDGVVSLEGEVDSSQQKELAAKIAANTAGAKSVENQLEVTSNDAEQEEAE